jgi:hypothetical protein
VIAYFSLAVAAIRRFVGLRITLPYLSIRVGVLRSSSSMDFPLNLPAALYGDPRGAWRGQLRVERHSPIVE